MKAYIKPRTHLLRIATRLLASSQTEEETIDFRFEIHTPSIWDDTLPKSFE